MCGVAGLLQASVQDNARSELLSMAGAIAHRGPDAEGVWLDAAAGIGLAHRRLSIVDLSDAGRQPMLSADNRYVLVFNGEIYNHQVLRQQLSPFNWRGHSDTETLLGAFSVWGIRPTLERCIGMFAFALWDRKERVLTLGRDRFGEKPLYYGWIGQGSRRSFLFGSELKALRAHSSFSGSVDRKALALYARHNCIPAPYSIYSDISKLMPGCLLTVSLNAPGPRLEQYWSLTQSIAARSAEPYSGSPEDAVNELDRLLKSAVGMQMMADVPLGAFLSGGIDSSTVVALMQAQSTRAVKTFTIGFNEAEYNEAEHAKAVAKHLGTDHSELYVSPQEALAVIPKLPQIYCEPFADSSGIPTYLVAKLAKQSVTVSLSGDAGDELFAGYNRYVVTGALWNKLGKIPRALRATTASAMQSVSPHLLNRILSPMQSLLPAGLQQANLGDKLHKGAAVLGASSVDELYRGLVSHWDPATLVLGGREPQTASVMQSDYLCLDPVHRMMMLDTAGYLPDDILVKVDRALMAVSLEGRIPMLDHRVFEFAWSLPLSMKLRDGVGKWPLRQLLYRYVPKELIKRPKMGFAVPIDAWLRGPLRDWAEALLQPSRLRQEGYFEAETVNIKWQEHLSGRRNWQHQLWTVLMFQAWQEANLA
jgi:asparagine synthase (glutamine-hydrolysing)